MKKQRLDVLLAQMHPELSRNKIQWLILAGSVVSDSRKLDKPWMLIDPDKETLRLVHMPSEYVSRAAYKLLGAREAFDLSWADRVVMDVGSSTGGFTQVCLKYGANRVYAIDVGTNQLDYKLRTDDRVVVLEQTNARFITPEQFDPRPDSLVMDVSFISLKSLLPVLDRVLLPRSLFAVLIKPQFEVGKEIADQFHGVITDPIIQEAVRDDILRFVTQTLGWELLGVIPSPIKGMDGNQEFVMVGYTSADAL